MILFLISIAFVPMFLFASMYSQISRGFTASQAGLYIGIYFLGFIVAAQYGGRMLDKRGRSPSGADRLRRRDGRVRALGASR